MAKSSVVTEDEGIAVAGGPHDTLNFVVGTVAVTNAGGGIAYITFSSPAISSYDSTCGQMFKTTAKTNNLDATHVNDPIYSLVGGEITVNQTGRFSKSYDCTLVANASNSRSQADAWLERGAILVPGTSRTMYLRRASFGASCSASIILDITSGEVFRVRAVRTLGSATCLAVSGGTALTIKRL